MGNSDPRCRLAAHTRRCNLNVAVLDGQIQELQVTGGRVIVCIRWVRLRVNLLPDNVPAGVAKQHPQLVGEKSDDWCADLLVDAMNLGDQLLEGWVAEGACSVTVATAVGKSIVDQQSLACLQESVGRLDQHKVTIAAS